MLARVVDLRGVDLNRYRFDFDLTFSALAMHADGTIHHRYGGRDHRSADQWLSTPSFTDFLRRGLEAHALHEQEGVAPAALAPRTLESVPAFQKRDKGACIHCHNVFPALYEEARADGTWRDEDLWRYPPPGRIGLDLGRDEQTRVLAVSEGSPAAAAGLRAGDELVSMGARLVATASDLMAALDALDPGAVTVPLRVLRKGEELTLSLELTADWKRGTPLSFSWRPFKWGLNPAPGFGGPELDAAEKARLGLASGRFAFRITYLVTWGENQRYGRAAARAGLREGDVVVGLDGKQDFRSTDHVHAWWRLTREPDDEVQIDVLRGGEPLRFTIQVLP